MQSIVKLEPLIKAPRVTPLEWVSTYATQGIRVRGVENPQGFGIDERRLNAPSLDIQDAIFEADKIFDAAFEKNREWHLNLRRKKGLDKNPFGIKRKPLAIINDKSRATNLRLSAFICGLKFDNTRQPDFTKTDLFTFYSGKLISYECEELRT